MNKRMKNVPLNERPREKLISRGAAALSNYELMAVILGSGNRSKDALSLAKDIVDLAGNSFREITIDDLMAVEGMGVSKSSRIAAAFEYFRRCTELSGRIKVNNDKDVFKLTSDLSEKRQEHFVTITLDGANNLIKRRTVFIGTLNQSIVHPREVFAGALEDRAAAIIVVHNHPSGNTMPSEMDIAITRRLKYAGELLGIDLVDHVIVAGNSYYSFRENLNV